MAGIKEVWITLAKNLKAEIDEEKIEGFSGTVPLLFALGKAVAVKIFQQKTLTT